MPAAVWGRTGEKEFSFADSEIPDGGREVMLREKTANVIASPMGAGARWPTAALTDPWCGLHQESAVVDRGRNRADGPSDLRSVVRSRAG